MSDTEKEILQNVTEVSNATPVPPIREDATPLHVQTSLPWYKNRQTLVALAIGIIILGGAGLYVYNNTYKGGGTVALVNGTHIYLDELNESVRLLEESAKAQGVDLSDPVIRKDAENQALQALIENALILGSAHTAGFVATNDAIDTKYAELANELGGIETLTARMEQVGLSEKQLRKNIRDRIIADQFIESETSIKEVAVTDEELTQIYETIKKDGPDVPPLEEIRDALQEQILSQKREEAVATLIARLRDTAIIEIR